MKSFIFAILALAFVAGFSEAGGGGVSFRARARFGSGFRQSAAFNAGCYGVQQQFVPVYQQPVQQFSSFRSVQQTYSVQQQFAPQVYQAPIQQFAAPVYAPSCGVGAQFAPACSPGYGGCGVGAAAGISYGGYGGAGASFSFRARSRFR